MSNQSGASTGSSNYRGRASVVGVPKVCWCGAEILAKNSKSDPNPARRYFRCSFAASKKLMNDNHIFKWVDEALLDEVATLGTQIGQLKEKMKELKTETMNDTKMVFERMQMDYEKMLVERVEEVMFEAKAGFNSRMNKMIIVLVLGCMIMFVLFKLV